MRWTGNSEMRWTGNSETRWTGNSLYLIDESIMTVNSYGAFMLHIMLHYAWLIRSTCFPPPLMMHVVLSISISVYYMYYHVDVISFRMK